MFQQYPPIRQINMNTCKRITRRTSSAYLHSSELFNEAKLQSHRIYQTKTAISRKNCSQMLRTLNQYAKQNHWAKCQKAEVLWQMGQTREPLKIIRKLVADSQTECSKCIKILLQIIQKSRPKIKKYLKLIQGCLEMKSLPKTYRKRLQRLQQEIMRESRTYESEMVSQQGPDLDTLINNYQKKGGVFPKVEVKQLCTDYRVAIAKSTIFPYEVVIKIPQKQMITLELARKTKEVLKIQKNQLSLKSPKHCMLSVFLLIEKNKGVHSFFHQYLLTFPVDLENFPIYYNQEELSYLVGTTFLSSLRRKKKDLIEDYNVVIKLLPELKKFMTYQKFVWIRMIVSSRIFGIIYNGSKTDALVPVADMLNHRAPKMTSWYYCEKEKAFIVQNSSQPIQQGQQIFDSYGDKCNGRFLLNYGFTTEQNTANEVGILMKQYKDQPFRPGVKLSTDITADQFQMMLSYYRYYASHQNIESESEDETQSQESKRSKSKFINKQNELRTWKLIQQTMEARFSQYETTIEYDEELLKNHSGHLTFNLRNCVIVRLGEKRVVKFYCQMAQQIIQYLSKGTRVQNYEPYREYLRSIRYPLV